MQEENKLVNINTADTVRGLGKLTTKVQLATMLKTKLDEQKRAADETSKRLEETKREILLVLDAAGLDNFDTPFGSVFQKETTSVRVPKSPEARESFFAYLKSQGIFDDMITVNSQTLNAWYRAEESAQLENGNVDFRVPGIDEVTTYKQLTLRVK